MPPIRVCLLLAVASPAAAQTKPRVTPDDSMRVVNVSDPQLSPDGKSIACIVSRPNVAEDRYESEIVLVDVATGKQRPLTFERRRVNAPRWSPSGDRLAFLDNAPTGEKKEPMPQIWVLPMDGGEGRRATRPPRAKEKRRARSWGCPRGRAAGRAASRARRPACSTSPGAPTAARS